MMISSYKNIEIFLDKFEEKKEEIFKEIHEFFNYKTYSNLTEFIECFREKLSKEPNECKQLNNGLFLKYGLYEDCMYLTDKDKDSSFKLNIDYIKKIKTIKKKKDTDKEESEEIYIISEQYYSYIFQGKIVKYKLENESETISMESDDVNDIILDNKLECLIIN